jgi:hypothetical protein
MDEPIKAMRVNDDEYPQGDACERGRYCLPAPIATR